MYFEEVIILKDCKLAIHAMAEDDMKLLSGLVPAEIYWEFKKQAAQRKEKMQEALKQAALMYITACTDREE